MPHDEQSKQSPVNIVDHLVQTRHTVTISGARIAYTATTGTLVLNEEAQGDDNGAAASEQPKATIFFVAYTRDDVPDAGARPLTFAFNGGPGSSSVWLHLGLLGPRRVLMDAEGWAVPPPAQLVENEYSLLDSSDLVFIDPVSTGYSRAVAGEKPGAFHDFKKDIESVGDFIRLYVTRYRRWLSPKFLAGESYGTTRAAALSGYLQERHGLYLNGLMLISAVLNFQAIVSQPGNDLPFALFLPSYTAAAWYHNKLDAELQRDLHAALREAERFALGQYTAALMQGAALPADERAAVAQQLARLTGLAVGYVERSNLRIHDDRFVKELLRDDGHMVGRLDSRFTGRDRDSAGEHAEFDPSLAAITGPYTAALNHYVRADLAFASDLTYEVLTARVYPWRFAEHENRYVDVTETLRKAITTNPALRVHVASGYYDLATPYFAAAYDINHLSLPAALQGNVTTSFYAAGHMMYIQLAALAQLRAELVQFINNAVPS